MILRKRDKIVEFLVAAIRNDIHPYLDLLVADRYRVVHRQQTLNVDRADEFGRQPFNYEEDLVVRVHPEILETQQLPYAPDMKTIWEERLESIREHEKHLSRNGTVILKFWLNVSRDEQKSRLLARLDNPEKNWKFEFNDLEERRYWDEYMTAYERALNGSSTPFAPWYAIPADDKPYKRATIAEIIVDAMTSIGLRYPDARPEDELRYEEARQELGKPEDND